MMLRAAALGAAIALLPTPAPAQHGHHAAPAPAGPPPLYDDLGGWSHPVSTRDTMAQKYFDQGLRLYYGFNHDEASRAFREAARRDPDCAMAWWGVALAAGPNINLPMDEERGRIAYEAISRAEALAPRAGDADRAYIAALMARYTDAVDEPRAPLDSAYARAMADLAARRPDDVDAQVLWAESMMDLNPWNYWTHDGKPNPGTLELVAVLEKAMERVPDHPGANHFYIHAVEASPNPERAVAAAERLETLVPGAGHLVHMPSHIYARVGRYDDAREANRRAVAVDEKYIAEQKPQGVYPLMYYNHNIHFIWFTASMQGRSAEALEAARKVAGNVTAEMARGMPMIEFVPPLPALTLARFGRWEEVLREPRPAPGLRYTAGLWHWARGTAFAALGRTGEARAALDTLRALAASMPADQMVSINYAAPLLRVAASALAGEVARRARQHEVAVRELRAAVAAEDSLHYDEPPTWPWPVRQTLGAALLEAGRAAEAEAVYRADLVRHPENGWSLAGLARALRARKKAREAAAVEARFARAWSGADVKLTASTF